MDDLLRVRVIESLGDAGHDAQRLLPDRTAVGANLTQRAPLEMLEGDEEDALLLVAADVVDDHDAGVGETGGNTGLGQEPALVLFALLHGPDREADGLEGDRAVKGGVVDLVDHAHHAPAKLLADLVAADLGGQVRNMFARKPLPRCEPDPELLQPPPSRVV